MPEHFFGHRKRGCKAPSSPSFSAKTKILSTFVDRIFVLYYSFFIIQYSSFIKTDFRNE